VLDSLRARYLELKQTGAEGHGTQNVCLVRMMRVVFSVRTDRVCQDRLGTHIRKKS
jgi:hypothetical protein